LSVPVSVRPLAEDDLLAAQTWYEQQRPGLGAEFKAEVDRFVDQIQETPLIFPKVHRGARRARVGRFPYWLFFVPYPDRLEIVACFHVRRDPREIFLRIPA